MATILDAFLVTLGIDSKQFEEGIEHATQKGQESFKELAKGALEFFGILATAGAMVEFVKGQLEAEVSAGRLAKTLDTDVESLEAMEAAVKRTGGSAAGMDQSLKGLNSRLQLIAIHGPRSKMALQIFAGMGISEVALKGKDAIGVMGLLAEKMQGMSGAKAMALGERLGLDEATVRLLQKGKEGVEDLTKSIKKNVASKEQVEAAEVFEQNMLSLKGALAATGRQILTQVMPALLAMSAGLAKVGAWVRDHAGIVKVGLAAVAAGFIFVSAGAISAGIAAAWAWLMTLGPIDLIIGALAVLGAGIAWVYLEFEKWSNGQESILSGFFNFFKGIWDAIKGVVMTVFGVLKDILKTYIDMWQNAWDLLVGIFTGNGDKIKTAFKNMLGDLGHIVSQAALLIAYEFLRAFFVVKHAGARMFKALKAEAIEVLDWIVSRMNTILNTYIKIQTLGIVQHAFPTGGAGAEVMAGMALHPAAVSNSQSSSTSTRETHIGQINIQTQATDAQGIAKAIPGALQAHGGLVNQADGGIG